MCNLGDEAPKPWCADDSVSTFVDRVPGLPNLLNTLRRA